MELSDIVNEIVNYVPTIDFSVSKDDEVVSLFETTIRYLGGMLSAYDFLTGPLANLVQDKSNVKSLLNQAENLANILSFAFDTPSGVPSTNGLSQAGSLVLEWTHLSDLTGNKTYADLSQKAESYLLDPRPSSGEPFPGLVGSNINLSNGQFADGTGGWDSGDDSFYEYLIKMYVYDQSRFGNYKDR